MSILDTTALFACGACPNAGLDQITEALIQLTPRDLLAARMVVHAVIDLVISPHNFIGTRVGLLADLRANPCFKLWAQALKRFALIAGTVAAIGCGDGDPAGDVRQPQAVLVLVAMLAACPAARIPIKREVFAGVAELGDAFADHGIHWNKLIGRLLSRTALRASTILPRFARRGIRAISPPAWGLQNGDQRMKFKCTHDVCPAEFETEAERDAHLRRCLFVGLKQTIRYATSTGVMHAPKADEPPG